jgi:hypothetical protein
MYSSLRTVKQWGCLMTLLVITIVCHGQQQTVVWTSLENAAPNGAGLTRVSTAAVGGAISTQTIPTRKDGRIDVVFSGSTDKGYVGLSATNTNADYKFIEYCWYVDPKKGYEIFENGTSKFNSSKSGPSTTVNSIYSITRTKEAMHYLIDGVRVYSSTKDSDNKLFVDVSMTGTAATTIPPVTITYEDPMSPPVSLTAVGIDKSVIRLSWNDRATAETGFQVERSLSPSTGFVLIATLEANVTSYLDNSLAASTPYYYRVRAVNASTSSEYSNVASGMVASETNWLKNPDAVFIMGNNVGIGTPNPDAKLTVKGAVHAEEVRIDVVVPGPDYVFRRDYELRSLDTLQQYIDQHSHLPEIPSAAEMEKNGIEVSTMNMLLLKKVEELTLYILEQEKRIRALEQQKD